MDLTSSPLHQLAIQAALSSRWEEALELNQQIIGEDPKNVDALNRAGRAYFELGQLAQSKKFFESSLKYDPYNQIAAKFLKRIATFKKSGLKRPCSNHTIVPTDLFIKEPGKTKLVSLLKVAEPQKLSLLSCGATVNLVAKSHCVNVTDQNGEYLGILPDDIAHRLVKLMKGGNKYQAFVKSVKPNALAILIRESYRCARYKNQPSFPDTASSLTYSSDHIIVPDETMQESEEEVEEEIV